uniref:Variant surface glycoprotein 1148 n=1 Tax=Trypanosoma brucei TaxID=5691 RepID=M4SZF2_9TRYP|nr:variant surface glycoprotein 1148 [Trypanosoma brucei]
MHPTKTLLYVLSAALAPNPAAPTFKNPSEQAKTPCMAATQLSDMANSATEIIAAAAANIETMLQQSSRLEVVSRSAPADTAAAAALLAQAVRKRAASASAALTTNAAKLLAGAAALNRLAGSQETLAELATLKIADVTMKAVTTHTATSTKATIAPTLASKNQAACVTPDGKRQEDTQMARHDITHKHPLTIVTATPAKAGDGLGKDFTICGSNAGSPGDAPDPANCRAGENTNIGIKGGTILALQPEHTKTTIKDGVPAYDTISSAEKVPNQATVAKELALVAVALGAASEIEKASAVQTLENSYSDTETMTAIAKAIGGADATPDNAAIKEQVKNTAKTLFGENGSKIKKQIAELMKNFQPSKAAGSDGNKKLDSISNPDDLYKATTYYTIKKFIDEEEKKKKNQASPSCPTKQPNHKNRPNQQMNAKSMQQVKIVKRKLAVILMRKKTQNAFLKLKLARKMKSHFVAI